MSRQEGLQERTRVRDGRLGGPPGVTFFLKLHFLKRCPCLQYATIPAPPQNATIHKRMHTVPMQNHTPSLLGVRGGCCPPCGAAAGRAGRAMRSRAPRL